MPGPKPPEVVLNEVERRELERLVCARRTGPAAVRRARVGLLAAGYTNLEIARQVPMDIAVSHPGLCDVLTLLATSTGRTCWTAISGRTRARLPA